MSILRQAENGVPVSELCREHGMSSASFYKWRAKFGEMEGSMMSERKAIAEENRRLKRMYPKMSMQNDLLKEALEKSFNTFSTQRDGRRSGAKVRGKLAHACWTFQISETWMASNGTTSGSIASIAS